MIAQPFNDDWYVVREGDDAGNRVGPVTLPYDAMLFERRDPHTPNAYHTGFFPGGVYRYSKLFRPPAEWRGRSTTLELEGVYRHSEVFVNGQLAGGHPSGYSLFRVVLDEHLEPGADNLIEVVAHNNRSPNSRWYSGSGIYRPVHLLVGGRVRVAPDGLRLGTSTIEGPDGRVDVAVTIVNDEDTSREVTLDVLLAGPDGRTTSVKEPVVLGPRASTVVRQLVTVAAADLWSPDAPQLYTATVRLTDGDELIDEAIEDFGIRTLTVDARSGLRINGQQVKLRGACIHHDHGVIGAHTLDAAEDRRVRLLKEAGFNAIRSAHNPAARALLRACDRHGVLVMDELTDAWWRPKVTFDRSEEFEQWWERDLSSMVAKDVNHPSVIMYSIGNEIAETATPRGAELNRRIAERTRELDPSRPVTNCINGFLSMISPKDDEKIAKKNAANREGAGEPPNKNLILILNYIMGVLERTLTYIVRLPAVDKRTRDAYAAVDVAGYNYMLGRFRSDGRRHPHRVIVSSESNPTDTVAIWQEIEHLPHVIGDFTWTGWDYIGEAGYGAVRYDERRSLFSPWPGLTAGMPVIDITGHRQTQSYLNEIVWHRRTGPHIAVRPVNHSGQKRVARSGRTDSIRSWSWEGLEGHEAVVEVYADAHRVKLLLDGEQVGAGVVGAKRPYLTELRVPYRAGQLTAVAYTVDGGEIGRDTISSAGPELRLLVQPETPALRADGADLLYVPISLTDAAGTVRPLADRPVTVEVTGAGALLGLGSGESINDEDFTTGSHSTYYGRALAVVRAGHVAGDVTVTVTADGCAPVRVVIPVTAVELPVRAH